MSRHRRLEEGEFGDPFTIKNARGTGYLGRIKYREDGKLKTLEASASNERDAKAAVKRKRDAKRRDSASVPTLDELMADYPRIAEERGRPKPRTVADHVANYRRYVTKPLGSLPVDELTKRRVNALLGSLTGARPQGHAAISVLTKEAMLAGWIEVDPAKDAFSHASKKVNPTEVPPSDLLRMEAAFRKEAERLGAGAWRIRSDRILGEDRLHKSEPRVVLDVFLTMRDSGLRLGEALALRARDFNPETGALTVEGTMSERLDPDGKTRRFRQQGGKTDAATRTVVLPALTRESARDALTARKLVSPSADSPLIWGRGRVFLHDHSFRTRWRSALARFAPDLVSVNPHLMRHTVATRIVNEAIEKYGYFEGLERARLQLGHASTKPLRHYVDRTRQVIDNSQLLAATTGQDERLLAAVRDTAALHESEVGWVGYLSGKTHVVVYDGDSVAARAAIDERWVGAVIALDPDDPRVEVWVGDDGQPEFAFLEDNDFG